MAEGGKTLCGVRNGADPAGLPKEKVGVPRPPPATEGLLPAWEEEEAIETSARGDGLPGANDASALGASGAAFWAEKEGCGCGAAAPEGWAWARASATADGKAPVAVGAVPAAP